MFGKESTGIPKQILFDNFDTTFRIPMVKEARSINIANTVVLLILLDQELLGGPSELPTLHLPLCGLHHYGGQAVLQFAAAVKI